MQIGYGILGRFPVITLVSFVVSGIAIGIGLSYWEPAEDDDSKDILLQWLGLLGDMFIRCLQLVVLPLVFINVIISVVDMVQIGKAGVIGSKTVIFYLTTTVVGAVIGIISVLVFRHRFSQGDFPGAGPAIVSLGCNGEGHFVTETADGLLKCMPKPEDEDMDFVINDLNGAFVTDSGGVSDDLSLSDTIY